MKLPILALAGAALAGCATAPDTSAIRSMMQAQIATWNAAGVDPVQLAPQELMYATLACGTLSGIGSVLNPDAPTLSDELAGWCALAVAAAAPAAPIEAPEPLAAPG